MGVGLTNNGGSCSRLSLTSFFLPLDLNGFSAREALPVPWIQKVHASLGSQGERDSGSLTLSLSLSLSASAGGAAAGIFPQAFSAISGPSSSQPGPESERGLIGRKLKPSQTNTEVRFLFN